MKAFPPKYQAALVMSLCALGASGCAMSAGSTAAQLPTTRDALMARVSGWSDASRMAATYMLETYGPPAELTATSATWHETGPWKRTIISAEETPHDFPAPHTDVMEQFVDYRVPVEMYDDLAAYDGSVIVERTRGEMSARCDLEAANFLALNLADEIVRGRRTVADARAEYGRQIMAFKAGRPSPYTGGLMFSPPASGRDPDAPLPMASAGE